MLINAFVGGMVGLERTVMPLIGTREFHVLLNTAAVSFIISFGLVKAVVNLVSGKLADHYGRKRILVAGWLIGVPIPFLIMWAPHWNWIVVANILLGINQGLTWSMAVVMKIDLAGTKQRGLAVGLNEFTGYLSVGLTAFATGYLATRYGLRPQPFYLGVGYVFFGLLLSAFALRETLPYARLENTALPDSGPLDFKAVFKKTTWGDRSLFASCQAGLINNLNDGMSWGIFPLFFASKGLGIASIGTLKFVYPAVWGVTQLATGPLSDRFGRKPFIVWGMIVQAVAIWLTLWGENFTVWILGSVLLGIGTAMVYPALLAEVVDRSGPSWRSSALGVYRFWRDLGYAIGALFAGIIADLFGFGWAIGLVGLLTFLSGLLVAVKMARGDGQYQM